MTESFTLGTTVGAREKERGILNEMSKSDVVLNKPVGLVTSTNTHGPTPTSLATFTLKLWSNGSNIKKTKQQRQQMISQVGGSRRDVIVNEAPCIRSCYRSRLQCTGHIMYSQKVVSDFTPCVKRQPPPQWRER